MFEANGLRSVPTATGKGASTAALAGALRAKLGYLRLEILNKRRPLGRRRLPI